MGSRPACRRRHRRTRGSRHQGLADAAAAGTALTTAPPAASISASTAARTWAPVRTCEGRTFLGHTAIYSRLGCHSNHRQWCTLRPIPGSRRIRRSIHHGSGQAVEVGASVSMRFVTLSCSLVQPPSRVKDERARYTPRTRKCPTAIGLRPMEGSAVFPWVGLRILMRSSTDGKWRSQLGSSLSR